MIGKMVAVIVFNNFWEVDTDPVAKILFMVTQGVYIFQYTLINKTITVWE